MSKHFSNAASKVLVHRGITNVLPAGCNSLHLFVLVFLLMCLQPVFFFISLYLKILYISILMYAFEDIKRASAPWSCGVCILCVREYFPGQQRSM